MNTTVLYVLLFALVIVATAALVKVADLQKRHYSPSNGEIYDEKITVSLDDSVFESHDSKTELGLVSDYVSCSVEGAQLTVALPYEAVAKSGRFLVRITENNLTRHLWVEPTSINKNYTLEAKKIDRFENVSSNE